jgi:divalent metal cation (Fe/Co/Zn/Cd) transporter
MGWKTKVFGDTRFNFYSWIVVGVLVFAGSFFEIYRASQSEFEHPELIHVLIAIWIGLMGLFGISMQNYCARVAKKLEEDEAKKKS